MPAISLISPEKTPDAKRQRSGDEESEAEMLEVPSTPTGLSESVTLEAIGRLMDVKLSQKLDPISKSIDQIMLDLAQFKENVRKEMNTMGLRITSVEKETFNAMSKLSMLQEQFENMKFQQVPGCPKDANDRVKNVFVGNIPGCDTFEAAMGWIQNHCKANGITQPHEMFFKTEYRGFVFAKCGSTEEKNKLIASITDAAKKMPIAGNKQLFAKEDLPIDIRLAENCLFQIKRMLTAWGYNKSSIKVETDSNPKILKIAGKEIVQATVHEYKLNMKWSDGEWETWEALQSSEQLGAIKKDVQGKLDQAKASGMSKGKGKSSQ